MTEQVLRSFQAPLALALCISGSVHWHDKVSHLLCLYLILWVSHIQPFTGLRPQTNKVLKYESYRKITTFTFLSQVSVETLL